MRHFLQRSTPALALVGCSLACSSHSAFSQDIADQAAPAPAVAAKRIEVADGLEIQLFAAEPLVEQPVSLSFDHRGRLWVLEYIQYPIPNGLKPTEVDQYLRTKYDRVPEPPPRGPTGQRR